ncbi:MAG: hypothetical protein V3G42_03420 [Oscillospiraceae bacterium]
MHNLYGKRKLNFLEIKGSFTLSNGMYCLWGNPKDEGLSVDIYDDDTKKLLIGMEHGIMGNNDVSDINRTSESLKNLMESFLDELEDSMVYYYGTRECTFEDSDITRPIPPKTGRFANK